jgi:hypothetical protein
MSGENPQATAVRQLRRLHAEMRPLLVLAGLPPEILDLPVQNLESVSLDSITAELDFLREFRDGPYEECRAYKEQKPDHFWVNLEVVFGNTSLPEQKLLRGHYKAVRRAWKKRYKLSKAPTMAKIRLPLKTEILKFLRDCGFDPRNQREMQAIAIVSRPDYCETRAMELIAEAQNPGSDAAHYDQCIMKAIQLLTLARMVRIQERDAKEDSPDRR